MAEHGFDKVVAPSDLPRFPNFRVFADIKPRSKWALLENFEDVEKIDRSGYCGVVHFNKSQGRHVLYRFLDEEAMSVAARVEKSYEDYLAFLAHEFRNVAHGVLKISEVNFMKFNPAEFLKVVGEKITQLTSVYLVPDRKMQYASEASYATKISLARFVRNAQLIVEPSAIAAGVKISTFVCARAHEKITISETHLLQALVNLLLNAIRYAGFHANVHLNARLETDGSGLESVCFAVSDDGPGIIEAEREKIFEKKYRGRESSSVAGSGLGLSIVQDMAHRVGGECGVNSPPELYLVQPGKGAEFWIRVPLARDFKVA